MLLEETVVDLGIARYHALPALINQEELVIGVVGPGDLARLRRGEGKTMTGLRWRPLTEAQGAAEP